MDLMYDMRSFHYNKLGRQFLTTNKNVMKVEAVTNISGTVFSPTTNIEIGREQFYIFNTDTYGRRRFRLQWETDTLMYFASEDGFSCVVYK
jgi:hypothetical protein